MQGNAYGTQVRIELLHVPGCANLDRARARLADALAAASVEASIREVEVATVEMAADVGMLGSPTILLDGVDPFASGPEVPALACRLFDTPDGIDGAPTVVQLIGAIAR